MYEHDIKYIYIYKYILPLIINIWVNSHAIQHGLHISYTL